VGEERSYLEEGGRDLERDAGEGECRVRWAWAGVERGWWWVRGGRGRELRGGRGRRVVAHRTVYRREGRVELVLLISVSKLLG